MDRRNDGGRGAAIIAQTDALGAHNYHPLPVVLERGEGVWVWDADGRRFMDMLSAYSALNHGHRHPRIIAALTSQAERITLTSRAFHNDKLGELYQRLHQVTGLPRFLPMNTGAEAVETAIKAVRKWGYSVKGVPAEAAEIIACHDNFHGRTVTIVSFSSEPAYRDGFGPFTPGFKLVPFGDIGALERAITPRTVGFLVEPIQGEAGINVPPAGYLRAAADLCVEHRIAFVADEIQTGFGRTGAMFGCDHEQVKPDVLVLGKALGGGVFPVSAVGGTEEVMGVFHPGEHGSTFGGNPLGAAVAVEALDVLVEEKLVDRSRERGAQLMAAVKEIGSPHVAEVRGKGLMVGIELKPEAGGARRFCEALMADGILCKETHENVIRLAPPLVIEPDQIDWALERLRRVLTAP